jgi:predicted acetyltransferase
MDQQIITLIEPTLELGQELIAMAEEFRDAGDDRYKSARANFPAYVHGLLDAARGVNLPPDRMPSSEFWLVSGRHIIGRSKLRYTLTPALKEEGGNIGYDIRPSERRKGYGTLILKLTMEKAREMQLDRVLVTCDTGNVGSAKIIEKNGGRLQDQAISKKSGKLISRYWIEL